MERSHRKFELEREVLPSPHALNEVAENNLKAYLFPAARCESDTDSLSVLLLSGHELHLGQKSRI